MATGIRLALLGGARLPHRGIAPLYSRPRHTETVNLKQAPAHAAIVVAAAYPQQISDRLLHAASGGMQDSSRTPRRSMPGWLGAAPPEAHAGGGWPGAAPPDAHAMTSDELEQRVADGELSAPTIELSSDQQIRQFAEETFENIKLKNDAVLRLRAERYLKYAHPEVKALGKSMRAAEEVNGIKKKHNTATGALEGMTGSKNVLERELREIEAQGSAAGDDIDKLKKKLRSNQVTPSLFDGIACLRMDVCSLLEAE